MHSTLTGPHTENTFEEMHVVRAVFSSSAHAETRAEEAAVRGELLRRRQGMVRSSSATSDPRLTPKATAAAASALLEAGLETSRLGGAAEVVIRASVSLARNRRLRTLGGGLGDESVGYGWAATRKNPESALGLMGCRVRSTLPHPYTPAAAKEAIRCSGARWNPNGGERMTFSGHLSLCLPNASTTARTPNEPVDFFGPSTLLTRADAVHVRPDQQPAAEQ